MIKRRTPIKKVSAKRAVEMKVYTQLRRDFLRKFFLCQVALAEQGFDHKIPPQIMGKYVAVAYYKEGVSGVSWIPNDGRFPRSTEVHHSAKRGKNYLNVDTWLAVSRHWHTKCENNKSWARSRGYLAY